jgi:hypothetical protein
MFPLDAPSGFGELTIVRSIEFPRLYAEHGPPLAGFVLSGV